MDFGAPDHLVQRRRLDVQELGGFLLPASRDFERRLDEPLVEIGTDLFEGNPLGRQDKTPALGSPASCARDPA